VITLRTIVLTAAVPLGVTTTAFAQDPAVKVMHGPGLMVSLRYDTPTASPVAIAMLIPTRKPYTDSDWGLLTREGVEIEASYGLHGARVAAGYGGRGKSCSPGLLFGTDLLGNVTRTWGQPTRGTANSTYVGVEGGWVFLSVRTTIGVAHRVAGPKGPGGTIFTWSAGLEIPLKW